MLRNLVPSELGKGEVSVPVPPFLLEAQDAEARMSGEGCCTPSGIDRYLSKTASDLRAEELAEQLERKRLTRALGRSNPSA